MSIINIINQVLSFKETSPNGHIRMTKYQDWGQEVFDASESLKRGCCYTNDIRKIISVLFFRSKKGINHFHRDIILHSKTIDDIIVNNTTDIGKKIFYFMKSFIEETCEKSIRDLRFGTIPYHRKICFELLKYLDEFPELEDTMTSIMIDLYKIFTKQYTGDKYVNLLCIEFSWMLVPPFYTDNVMVDKFFALLGCMLNSDAKFCAQNFADKDKTIECNINLLAGVLCESSLDERFDIAFESFLMENLTSMELLLICKYFVEKRVTDRHRCLIGYHCFVPFFSKITKQDRWYFQFVFAMFSRFNLDESSLVYDRILEYIDQMKEENGMFEFTELMTLMFSIFPRRCHEEITRIFLRTTNFLPDIVPARC